MLTPPPPPPPTLIEWRTELGLLLRELRKLVTVCTAAVPEITSLVTQVTVRLEEENEDYRAGNHTSRG